MPHSVEGKRHTHDGKYVFFHGFHIVHAVAGNFVGISCVVLHYTLFSGAPFSHFATGVDAI
jgi:hypothetical protein